MNIIPLVSAFIIVITLFVSAQFQNIRPLFREEKAFKSRQQILTAIRRDMAHIQYKVTVDKTSLYSANKIKPINLQYFIKNPHATELSYITQYLSKLYPHLPSQAIKDLLQTIIHQGSLDYNMDLKNPEQQSLLLELLQGAHNTPPLMNVLCIDKNDSTLFRIDTLTKEQLYLFVSQDLAKALLAEKRKPKDKEEIKISNRLKQCIKNYEPALANLIDCSTGEKHVSAAYSFVDKKTGIRLSRYEPY